MKVVDMENTEDSESKRSLLGKMAAERKQLGARKRVTDHQLSGVLDRQGQSLESEER